jgi:hypothetical protein
VDLSAGLRRLGFKWFALQDFVFIFGKILTHKGAIGSLADLSKVWSKFYARDEQIFPPIGGQCKKCEFRSSQVGQRQSGLNQCWSKVLHLTEAELQKPLVLDLWNGRNVANWIQQKTYLMEQLTAEQIGLPMTEAEAETGPTQRGSTE